MTFQTLTIAESECLFIVKDEDGEPCSAMAAPEDFRAGRGSRRAGPRGFRLDAADAPAKH